MLFFLFAFLATNCFAENTTEAVPYEKNEFPPVLKNLRRAEIITFGSLPFVSLTSSLVYSFIRYGASGGKAEFPNPFSTNNAFSTKEHVGLLLTSLGISFGIGLTDFIVQSVKHKRAQKTQLLKNDPISVLEFSDNFSNIVLESINFSIKEAGAESVIHIFFEE